MDTISIQRHDKIAVLSLNQPKTLNAMSFNMAEEFRIAIDSIKQQQDIRVLIVTGEGGSFCSGGDLNSTFSMYDQTPTRAQQTAETFYKKFLAVRNLEIPTIAAIKGHTVGAGLCLAMACDMRIASSDTKIAMSFIKLGLNPGMGGTYFLPRLVGTAKALELCLVGDTIDANEAHKIGLLNYVVNADELMQFTFKLASRIADNAPVPAHLIKKAIYQGLDEDLNSALSFEALAQTICASTKDFKEGVAAIKEKRRPVFSGE